MAKYWTEEKIAELRAYRSEGLTLKEISLKIDKTVDSIDHACRRYHIDAPDRVAVDKAVKITKAEKDKLHVHSTLTELSEANLDHLKKKAKLDWNLRKTRIKPIKKGKKPFVSYLVVGDMHIPEHNFPAIKAIFDMMDDNKFDGLVNIGDFMDLACISHWNKTKRLTSEGMKIKEDYIIGNAILDEFDKRLPEGCDKHFLFGNHEEWYYQFIDLNPTLEGMFHPTDELKLVERGYTVYDHYNDDFSIGKLTFTHGIYAGANYVKKHLDEGKTNIIFGHTHSERIRYSASFAKQLSIAGYCLGCLCSMSPGYMKNKPNAWTNGFAIVHFYPDGSFEVDLKRILKGRFIHNGVVYDGNQ